MEISQLKELYYITPISNLQSILKNGILSYNLAKRIHHVSLAHKDVQNRRENKRLPNGKPLHDYANLYICARNPMLFYLSKNENLAEVCVLGISIDVIMLKDVVISDRNAARMEARFAPAPDGLKIVDNEKTFAKYWTNEDYLIAQDLKARKCAEVLVPYKIKSEFITEIYVSCEKAKATLKSQGFNMPIKIDDFLFFNRSQ